MNVLKDRPELDAIASHEAHSPFDRGQVAEGGELIEQIEDRHGGFLRITGHVEQALRDEQAQPAGIGGQAIGRQDEEHRDVAVLEIGKAEIGSAEHGGHARAVEEMGMALRGREDASGLPIGFAQVAVCGASDQAGRVVAFLHPLEQGGELVRGEGEIFAQGCEVSPAAGFMRGDFEDQAGNERLGFLVPMRLAGHARFIEHERVGQGAGIFRDIEAGRVELVEGIKSAFAG